MRHGKGFRINRSHEIDDVLFHLNPHVGVILVPSEPPIFGFSLHEAFGTGFDAQRETT